jgi:hypothetical protein
MATLKSLTIGGQKFEVQQGGVAEGGFKGLKENLPVLGLGKMGFCTDTGELFIGSSEGNTLYAKAERNIKYQGTINNTATGNLPLALKEFIAFNFESLQASAKLNLLELKVIYKGVTYSNKDPLLGTQAKEWVYYFLGINPTLEPLAASLEQITTAQELEFNMYWEHGQYEPNMPLSGYPYFMDFELQIKMYPKRDFYPWDEVAVNGSIYYGIDSWDYSLPSINEILRARFYNVEGTQDNLDTDNYELIIEAKEIAFQKPFNKQLELHKYMNGLGQFIPYQVKEDVNTLTSAAPFPYTRPYGIRMYTDSKTLDIPKIISSVVKRVTVIESNVGATSLTLGTDNGSDAKWATVYRIKKAFVINIPLETGVNSFSCPIGTEITFIRETAGVIEFVPLTNVTLISKSNHRKISVQNGVATLTKIGSNSWLLTGDLGA